MKTIEKFAKTDQGKWLKVIVDDQKWRLELFCHTELVRMNYGWCLTYLEQVEFYETRQRAMTLNGWRLIGGIDLASMEWLSVGLSVGSGELGLEEVLSSIASWYVKLISQGWGESANEVEEWFMSGDVIVDGKYRSSYFGDEVVMVVSDSVVKLYGDGVRLCETSELDVFKFVVSSELI